MPITKSAKKRVKSSSKKAVFNVRRKRAMKNSVKEVNKLIVLKGKKEAEAKLPELYKAIDKAAKRGVIKKNTAARKKSRITQAIAKLDTK